MLPCNDNDIIVRGLAEYNMYLVMKLYKWR